ncbi:MAG: hypothetical protein D6795_11150 [Deltaproteobacteria bacterium]|nr:MAG: hypothetical protein D6795_11150 [Deltaproteobacteria bacterium]
MPFCPKCSAEYEPGIEKCYDCGVPLVETLPPEAEEKEEEFVEVFRCFDIVEAELVSDLLKEAGIDNFIHEMSIPMFPINAATGSERRIAVGMAERERAVETIRKAIEEERYTPVSGEFLDA